ncbi:MAG: hypothetical protein L0Y74_01065, partial [candidate division Zixibacteria bacterium]|nr:hypothetical protein [candidate division Zixibacteria bacterium]
GAIAVTFLPQIIFACDKCFGAKVDTPVTQGIGFAMLALLGITGSVLGGISAFFIYLWRRSKMFEEGKIIVTEQGNVLNHPGLLRDMNKTGSN